MVCNSSIKIMAFLAAANSSIIFLRRCSNSPRYLVPATTEAKSNASKRFPASTSEISPRAIFCASPSTIAVLPTPGSPIKTGLFLVRRAKICTRRSISSSRPITGSNWFLEAISVKSRVYSSSVGVLLLVLVAAALRGAACSPSSVGIDTSPAEGSSPPVSPISATAVSRKTSTFTPKLDKILPAIPSSSRISPSKICSVPICSLFKSWDSSTENSNTFLARGVKGISPSSIMVSPIPISFSISKRTLRNVTPKLLKILFEIVPSIAHKPSKICSVPT